jgi:hypothetical protein
MTQPPPAGWYADPGDAQQQRYWDGGAWTAHTSPTAPGPEAPLPPPNPAEAPTGPRAPMPRPLIVALAAAAAAFVGSLMPWVSIGIISANGSDGDGKIVLFGSLISAGLLMASTRGGKRYLIIGGIAALICFATSLYDTIHVSQDHTEIFGDTISASVGSGLWLDLIASTVLVGAIVQLWRTRDS